MKMQIQDGLSLEYPAAEQETASTIAGACQDALALIREAWGLAPPADCRLYLMTSPARFFFQSAPLAWKLLLGLGFPIWYPRAKRTWPISAAWTQRYGGRVVIGIKPPALWQHSDTSIGRMIYVEDKDSQRKLRHLACHELFHACSTPLSLPAWLNEGLAVLTVERFIQAPVFRADTLERVRDFQPKEPPAGYRELVRRDKEAIAYAAVRGYWLVRYIHESHPGLLNSSIAGGGLALSRADALIEALGQPLETFWQEIDGILAAHFS